MRQIPLITGSLLGSLGVALLGLSVILVPTTVLADSGGGTPPNLDIGCAGCTQTTCSQTNLDCASIMTGCDAISPDCGSLNCKCATKTNPPPKCICKKAS